MSNVFEEFDKNYRINSPKNKTMTDSKIKFVNTAFSAIDEKKNKKGINLNLSQHISPNIIISKKSSIKQITRNSLIKTINFSKEDTFHSSGGKGLSKTQDFSYKSKRASIHTVKKLKEGNDDVRKRI